MSSVYIVDANVMIEAARGYYAFETVPGFWDWLDSGLDKGAVRTISLVAEEIDHPQPLADWMSERDPANTLLDISEPRIQKELTRVGEWIVGEPFGPEHISRFLSGADPWLVAAASATRACVVTQEVAAGQGTKKVKLPDVCGAFDVRCIGTFEMLKECKAQF